MREGEAPKPGQFRATNAASDVYGEFVGGAPARGSDNCALAVPTDADSTAAGLARDVYEIDVHATPLTFIGTSDPDSGYSVDHLPPAAAAPFTAAYTAGSGSQLAWGNNVEPDPSGYRLFRGAAASFVPSVVTPNYDGVAPAAHDNGGPAWFKVTACDRHGNEGSAATVPSGGTVSADDAVHEIALRRVCPNPACDGVVLALELASGMRVRVSVYDAQGREVRRLADGAMTAGRHALRCDGGDRDGHAARPGPYFARLVAEGVAREVRFVMVRRRRGGRGSRFVNRRKHERARNGDGSSTPVVCIPHLVVVRRQRSSDYAFDSLEIVRAYPGQRAIAFAPHSERSSRPRRVLACE